MYRKHCRDCWCISNWFAENPREEPQAGDWQHKVLEEYGNPELILTYSTAKHKNFVAGKIRTHQKCLGLKCINLLGIPPTIRWLAAYFWITVVIMLRFFQSPLGWNRNRAINSVFVYGSRRFRPIVCRNSLINCWV